MVITIIFIIMIIITIIMIYIYIYPYTQQNPQQTNEETLHIADIPPIIQCRLIATPHVSRGRFYYKYRYGSKALIPASTKCGWLERKATIWWLFLIVT